MSIKFASLLCSAAVVGCSAIGATDLQAVTVTVRNLNALPAACIQATPSLSVFNGATEQHAIPHEGYATFEVQYAPTLGAYQFGIQDNGWYWRTVANPYTGQMADNAGGQVYISDPSTCAFHTGPSFVANSPPADQVLTLTSGFNGSGHCEFNVTRQQLPSLCITTNCMDCSRFAYAKDECNHKYGVVDSTTCKS